MKLLFKCMLLLSCVVLVSGCSNDTNKNKELSDIETITEPTTDSQEQKSIKDIDKKKEDITLEEDLANRFHDNISKELEDEWKLDKTNEQLSAMYFYDSALFYEQVGEIEDAKDSMSNVKSSYAGVLCNEIKEYGVELFGSIEVWDQCSDQKNGHKHNMTDEKRIEIKEWIRERYDYYDEVEGGDSGEKYTDQIFQEAQQKFGLSSTEVDNVWFDLP